MRRLLALAVLVAAVPVAASATTIGDSSFESPAVSGYAYDPAGTAWTFAQSAGISANGGPFYVGNAPDGTQAAFIRSTSGSTGQISQTLTGLVQGA